MRIITAASLQDSDSIYAEVADVLKQDGIVCFPCRRQYFMAASLFSESAVLRLVQAKRRSGSAPSLVFIPDKGALRSIVDNPPACAHTLIDSFWPGQLTMLFAPTAELPPKVLKTVLHKKLTKIGVRVPEPGIPLRIVQAFNGPLLASSANLSRKVGATSVANIRKSFSLVLDMLVDAGDLQPAPPSTIVDVEGGSLQILREGGIPACEIRQALGLAEPCAGH